MQLKLVKADMDNQSLIVEMLEEWTDYNCHHDAVNKTPIAIFKEDYRNWEKYLKSLEGKGDGIKIVPATTLFCLDEETLDDHRQSLTSKTPRVSSIQYHHH